MAKHPSKPLQAALVRLLANDAGVQALVGKRVYDLVSADAKYPYVTIGGDQFMPQRTTCVVFFPGHVTLNAWSDEPGFPKVKEIVSAMFTALDNAALDLGPDFRLNDCAVIETRTQRDDQTLLSLGVVTLRVEIQSLELED